jgi:hypothetical protein
MLELVGNPIAVNPEKDLKEAAEANDWPILEFQRPVSVGKKVPAPPPQAWIAVGAAVVTGAIVAYALNRKKSA